MSNTEHHSALVTANTGLARSLRRGLSSSLKTLALSTAGTIALVGAHHLGRKQYNANARLMDYVEGVTQALFTPTKVAADTKPFMPEVSWVSGVADLTNNEFAVVGIDSQHQICWQTAMPERVHDILIQPNQESSNASAAYNNRTNLHNRIARNNSIDVAVMGRRPSEWFWVLAADSGKLRYSIKAEANRHFYGHACYSLEGDLLYVTENNTSDFSGVIGIYDVASGYRKIGEFTTEGIGPHEIVMHPDGKTLVIANGGIKTERASREELNIDSMQPSLVYLDRHKGKLIQQVYPVHNQMSVRHLTMHDDGTVIIGIQFQGERHLNVPMVLTHRLGQSEFTALQMDQTNPNGWHRFHHYIASVSVDSNRNLVCATSPIGGCAAVFDLNSGELIESVDLADCAGVAVYPSSTGHNSTTDKAESPTFLVSDGQGALTQIKVNMQTHPFSVKVEKVQQPYAFDNHLNVIERK
ncbi:DUF1513 domain-containing protein [Psychrobacter sanguinis]|uniref:DUF1513 domain-containing protein n=1 Tax=Psychrobacter sanguinis TaxID=861445 RepID=UPI002A752D25|nr:DUF1513 domain-containing protein [Psychrobacter sanguinis]MDY3305210.1 DUF1513 domain-containing protein [Psychrobacter sanguinis]